MYILFLLVNCIRKTNQNSYVYKEKLSIMSSYADFWYLYGIWYIMWLLICIDAHTRIFNWRISRIKNSVYCYINLIV